MYININSSKQVMNKISYDNPQSDACAGFSLLEAAIAIIVIGLISLPIFRALQQDAIKESFNKTNGILAEAEASFNQFYSATGASYPCPASLSLGPGDSDYGKSRVCSDLSNILVCANPNWFTDPANITSGNSGICKTTGAPDAVIVGGIPFADLKIDHESAIDYWNNKIIYAVPQLNTNTDPADNAQGIQVIGLNPTLRTVENKGFAEIVLFSTGQTARGGFTKAGQRQADCGNFALEGYDNENCDFDNIFFRNQGNDGAFSLAPGAEFYDDIIRVQESFPFATWFEHEDNPTDPDNRFAITSAESVGVGTVEPENTLHVVGGSLRVATGIRPDGTTFGGRLKTDGVCNDEGLACFDPEAITGTLPEMECDANGLLEGTQAVLGIGTDNNTYFECSSAHDSAGNVLSTGTNLEGDFIPGRELRLDTDIFEENEECPLGEVATGIDSTGALTCAVPPS